MRAEMERVWIHQKSLLSHELGNDTVGQYEIDF